jgi:hypothetical protein
MVNTVPLTTWITMCTGAVKNRASSDVKLAAPDSSATPDAGGRDQS